MLSKLFDARDGVCLGYSSRAAPRGPHVGKVFTPEIRKVRPAQPSLNRHLVGRSLGRVASAGGASFTLAPSGACSHV